MANLVAIKTSYGRKLEEVFKKMTQGRKRIARLRDKNGYLGIHLQVMSEANRKYGWRPSEWWVTKIGCNSFGIEVYVQSRYTDKWQAIEQLSRQQQLRIANAIDWSTLE